MPLSELRQATKTARDLISNQFSPPPEDEHVPAGEALATWWVQATPGTTYWRCVVPARVLPGQALHLGWSDVKASLVMPRHRGVGIFQFVGNASRALVMALLQEQGVKALMEVDDDYMNVPPSVPGLPRSWTTKLDRSPSDRYSHQAHRKVLRWVDGVIVSTPTLAERYSRATTAPVYLCPNSVDLDDWPADPAGPSGRNIGYAGSDSHRYDLALIERAMDWAWRQPDVTLYKIGVGTAEWRFPHERVPWANDLAQYRRNLQVLDVGLCPLKRNAWSDCKSDIKPIEYVLTGAVPIVQKAPPYADWFDVVPTCETEKDWLKAVKWACSAPPDELVEVWERARKFVLARKLIGQHIDKWRLSIA